MLGTDAARRTIMRQIHRTTGAHGMTTNTCHTMLLADLTTCKACALLFSSSIFNPHLAWLLSSLQTRCRSL